MAKKRALLLVKMDPPSNVDETDWNHWYNNVHLPGRLALPGFLFARRFASVGYKMDRSASDATVKYLTLVDLDGTTALKSAAYQQLYERDIALPSSSFEFITRTLPTFTRGVYEQIFPEAQDYRPPDTRYVYVVGHDVPRNKHAEFNAWYNTGHIPNVLRVPGFVAARRFKLSKQFPLMGANPVPQYISVYDIDRENPFQGEIFKSIECTPWNTWARTWFTRRLRIFGRRIYPEG
ncbi:MAG: hypothetical protein Q7R57_07725 [Dehalococcoidales bacterium]|nr:hypothetical protein [Dehalococcoidales bacterium]